MAKVTIKITGIKKAKERIEESYLNALMGALVDRELTPYPYGIPGRHWPGSPIEEIEVVEEQTEGFHFHCRRTENSPPPQVNPRPDFKGDCGHVCGHQEPFGFVPEADCPIHDPWDEDES